LSIHTRLQYTAPAFCSNELHLQFSLALMGNVIAGHRSCQNPSNTTGAGGRTRYGNELQATALLKTSATQSAGVLDRSTEAYNCIYELTRKKFWRNLNFDCNCESNLNIPGYRVQVAQPELLNILNSYPQTYHHQQNGSTTCSTLSLEPVGEAVFD